ncbi:MBG domain-containing protein [Alcanivorax sp. JB21]|uniref:choice-of-anchor Q domain-containing protein n=1 Tax=Alcanivorax limicola TaxID=2874102 RepID=UPI001CBA8A8C|nr:choice-of-anchor Q domain-containing protein [Alcanivorax limicola]MBZ2187480.1 MBG domain-containing protein [Alcanivorax limicola]
MGLLLMLMVVLPATASALTFVVNSTADTTAGTHCQAGGTNTCTLRAAISEANAIPEAAHPVITVHIPADTYTLGDVLQVRRSMTFVGSGGNREGDPRATIIQAGATANNPANGQIMLVNPDWDTGFDTVFEALWFRHGYNTTSEYGGAIDWDGSEGELVPHVGTLSIYNTVFSDNVINTNVGHGGALGAYFGEQITIERTEFRNNRALGTGGAAGALEIIGTNNVVLRGVTIDDNSAEVQGGAAITRLGNLVMENTTVSRNRAEGDATSSVGGLAILEYYGDVRITNSTISGNTASGTVGGLELAPHESANEARLTHVTIADNRSGLVNANASAGGLRVVTTDAPTRLYNTLVAANFRGAGDTADDIFGVLHSSSQHNLIGTGGAGGLSHGANANQIGVADPGLFPLANYHGATETHALRNGSPALDAGNTTLPGVTANDQRGWPRAVAAASSTPTNQTDIGAYEAHPTLGLIADQTAMAPLSGTRTESISFLVGDASLGVTVSATSSNQSVLPDSALSLTGTGHERQLVVTLSPSSQGVTDITLSVSGQISGNQRERDETFRLTIVAPPALSLSKSHEGNFYQGQTDAAYTLVVSNTGQGPTNGSAVTLTDTLPDGMTAVSMAGTGWGCTLSPLACQRSDVLPSGESYPAVTLTVSVATDAEAELVNAAAVSGGGDADGDSTTDPTTILYATSTSLSSGGSTYGQDFELVATVQPDDTDVTGNVVFQRYNGSDWVDIGTAPLAANVAVFTVDGEAYDAGFQSFRGIYSGDTAHRGSQSGSHSHAIAQATQTITFASPGGATFGDSPVTLSASANSGLPVTLTSSDPTVATLSGTTLTIVGAGSSTLTATQAGNTNYLAATPVEHTFIVQRAQANASISNTEQVYDGTPRAVTVTTDPVGVSVTVTYEGSTEPPTDAGTYDVAVVINDDNYEGGETGTLVISKADQVITFNALAARTVGDADFTLDAVSDSGLPISYVSSDPSVATVSGNTVTIVAAGDTDITASQAGDDNYNAATAVVRTLEVNRAEQVITFAALAPVTFGDAPFTLTATADSNLPVSFASSDDSVATVSGNTVTIVGAGEVDITASQAGNDDYAAAVDVVRTLQVQQAAQTLDFDAISDTSISGEAFTITLTASASSGAEVSFEVLSGPASLQDDELEVFGAGEITVRATADGDANYQAVQLQRNFTVTATADAVWRVTRCDSGERGSLDRLLDYAVSGNRIEFEPALSCRGENAISAAAAGPFNIDQSLTIDGAGADIELTGESTSPVLYVAPGTASFTLRNLRVSDGRASLHGSEGPLEFRGTSTTIEDVIFTGHHGPVRISPQIAGGEVLVRNVVIENGQSGSGAIYLRGEAIGGTTIVATLENVVIRHQSGGLGAFAFTENWSNWQLTLRHMTVVDNDAQGAIYLERFDANTTILVENSVLWNNAGSNYRLWGTAGDVLTLRHNVTEGGSGGEAIRDGDPLLFPVSSAGALPYVALLPGSAALGAADAATCADTDIRGIARDGDRCDAGAFQSRGFVLAEAGGDEQETPINSDFPVPLSATVTSDFDEPVVGGQVTFTAPATGASLADPVSVVSIAAEGAVALPVTANGVVGSYQVTADTAGAAAPLHYDLENLIITTSLLLSSNAAMLESGDDIVLTAVLSANGALPSGDIVFQRLDDDDEWVALSSSALVDDTASLTVSTSAPGAQQFRARFAGNATHAASDWQMVTVEVFDAVSVSDPQGGPLQPGSGRDLLLAGGEGSTYDIVVNGPQSFSTSVTCTASPCTYRFTAPETGAFAGTYTVAVVDPHTDWSDSLLVDVPLRVSVARPVMLSLDTARNHTEVLVSGAAPGVTTQLTVDATADAAGILVSGSGEATDDTEAGHPAVFTVTLPDDLAGSLPTVSLSAEGPGLPTGQAALAALAAQLYHGSVSGPLGEPVVGGIVTLLSDTTPIEDSDGRYETLTDTYGDFTLIAPPIESDHRVEVMATGYQSVTVSSADCTTSCDLTMVAAVTAETPRFNPPAGEYEGWVTVRLESTTVGAMLRYTTDGTTPTLSHGTEVANNTELLLNSETTLKVIAYQVGLNVSEVAEATYTFRDARFTSKGGAAWSLLPLLALMLLRVKRRAVLLTVLLLASLTLPAHAGDGWYLGGALGWAMTDIDANDVEQRLANEGLPGTATVDDEDRLGWKLLGGYGWRYLAVEAGYVDLGEITTGLAGTGPVTIDQLRGIPAASGSGAEAALLLRYPFTERLAAYLRGGALRWETEYGLAGDTKRFSGTDATFGAGMQYGLATHWVMRLSWDRYTVEDDDSDLLSLGLFYRFGRPAPRSAPASERASEAASTPAPEPVSEPASEPELQPAPQPDPEPQPQPQPQPRLAPATPFTVGVVTFGFDTNEPVQADLDQVVTYLQAHPEAQVVVRGYTDNTGPQAHNDALSLQRAERVVMLLEAAGIASARLSAEGRGAASPLADNNTREGRMQNRRAEVILKP